MTKPITAAATILVEECVPRLDEPVDRLPELANRRVRFDSQGCHGDAAVTRSIGAGRGTRCTGCSFRSLRASATARSNWGS
jgi:hypothetical protein